MMATLKPRTQSITHVIFDMDGLLLGAQCIHTLNSHELRVRRDIDLWMLGFGQIA